jgi:hypothetical protein
LASRGVFCVDRRRSSRPGRRSPPTAGASAVDSVGEERLDHAMDVSEITRIPSARARVGASTRPTRRI